MSLCGEMASEAAAVPLLLGMGLDTFSVSNETLPAIGRQLRLQAELPDQAKLRQAALEVLELDIAAEVRRYVEQHFPQVPSAAL
ncbi:hypothetical protein IDH44_00930 [Paenibacillus sp. IB182496]|uniref:PEP-utilising enzyme C-terminal domain-containing protein n=1 Tax=Paenibacillus sabuli TaxID=2772509 RepID=A0A927BQK9_9BACL|nr:hypothetical protein [Paenibacillus sabuli]